MTMTDARHVLDSAAHQYAGAIRFAAAQQILGEFFPTPPPFGADPVEPPAPMEMPENTLRNEDLKYPGPLPERKPIPIIPIKTPTPPPEPETEPEPKSSPEKPKVDERYGAFTIDAPAAKTVATPKPKVDEAYGAFNISAPAATNEAVILEDRTEGEDLPIAQPRGGAFARIMSRNLSAKRGLARSDSTDEIKEKIEDVATTPINSGARINPLRAFVRSGSAKARDEEAKESADEGSTSTAPTSTQNARIASVRNSVNAVGRMLARSRSGKNNDENNAADRTEGDSTPVRSRKFGLSRSKKSRKNMGEEAEDVTSPEEGVTEPTGTQPLSQKENIVTQAIRMGRAVSAKTKKSEEEVTKTNQEKASPAPGATARSAVRNSAIGRILSRNSSSNLKESDNENKTEVSKNEEPSPSETKVKKEVETADVPATKVENVASAAPKTEIKAEDEEAANVKLMPTPTKDAHPKEEASSTDETAARASTTQSSDAGSRPSGKRPTDAGPRSLLARMAPRASLPSFVQRPVVPNTTTNSGDEGPRRRRGRELLATLRGSLRVSRPVAEQDRPETNNGKSNLARGARRLWRPKRPGNPDGVQSKRMNTNPEMHLGAEDAPTDGHRIPRAISGGSLLSHAEESALRRTSSAGATGDRVTVASARAPPSTAPPKPESEEKNPGTPVQDNSKAAATKTEVKPVSEEKNVTPKVENVEEVQKPKETKVSPVVEDPKAKKEVAKTAASKSEAVAKAAPSTSTKSVQKQPKVKATPLKRGVLPTSSKETKKSAAPAASAAPIKSKSKTSVEVSRTAAEPKEVSKKKIVAAASSVPTKSKSKSSLEVTEVSKKTAAPLASAVPTKSNSKSSVEPSKAAAETKDISSKTAANAKVSVKKVPEKSKTGKPDSTATEVKTQSEKTKITESAKKSAAAQMAAASPDSKEITPVEKKTEVANVQPVVKTKKPASITSTPTKKPVISKIQPIVERPRVPETDKTETASEKKLHDGSGLLRVGPKKKKSSKSTKPTPRKSAAFPQASSKVSALVSKLEAAVKAEEGARVATPCSVKSLPKIPVVDKDEIARMTKAKSTVDVGSRGSSKPAVKSCETEAKPAKTATPKVIKKATESTEVNVSKKTPVAPASKVTEPSTPKKPSEVSTSTKKAAELSTSSKKVPQESASTAKTAVQPSSTKKAVTKSLDRSTLTKVKASTTSTAKKATPSVDDSTKEKSLESVPEPVLASKDAPSEIEESKSEKKQATDSKITDCDNSEWKERYASLKEDETPELKVEEIADRATSAAPTAPKPKKKMTKTVSFKAEPRKVRMPGSNARVSMAEVPAEVAGAENTVVEKDEKEAVSPSENVEGGGKKLRTLFAKVKRKLAPRHAPPEQAAA